MNSLLTPKSYIYPPRADTAVPPPWLSPTGTDLYRKLGWKAQLKYNDTHILLDYDGNELIDVYDRHAKRPQYNFSNRTIAPHLQDLGRLINEHGDGRYLLDGGLLHSKHAALKDMIVIWDVLIKARQHLLGSTVQERHNWLLSLLDGRTDEFELNGEKIGYLLNPRVLIPRFMGPDEWGSAWELLQRVNRSYDNPLIEGLVYKDPRGLLKHGLKEKNNSDWMCRSRVRTGRHMF